MYSTKPCVCESGKLASRCKRMHGCKDTQREQRRLGERTEVDFKLESPNTDGFVRMRGITLAATKQACLHTHTYTHICVSQRLALYCNPAST